MYEGVAAGGLNGVYAGSTSISERVATSRLWATAGAQPNYVHLSMNSAISGGWRVGRRDTQQHAPTRHGSPPPLRWGTWACPRPPPSWRLWIRGRVWRSMLCTKRSMLCTKRVLRARVWRNMLCTCADGQSTCFRAHKDVRVGGALAKPGHPRGDDARYDGLPAHALWSGPPAPPRPRSGNQCSAQCGSLRDPTLPDV